MENKRKYDKLNNYVMNSQKIQKQIKKMNKVTKDENIIKQDAKDKKEEALKGRKHEVHQKAVQKIREYNESFKKKKDIKQNLE